MGISDSIITLKDDFDLSKEQLNRLHGPIGMYIGSKTPSEIAISILAELTAVKNGISYSDSMKVGVAKELVNLQENEDSCLLDLNKK